LSAFNGLIIPELSEALAKTDKGHINRVAARVLNTTVIFAGGASVFIFAFAAALGMTVYNSPDAAYYIRIFALLIPVMYLDSAVDAILKGMGEQVYSMKVNILDAGISALLVYLVLPFAGIGGYVAIIFFCELMNTFLSMMKLVKIIKVKFDLLTSFLIPVICSLGAVCTVRAIIYFTPLMQGYSVLNCVIKIGISLSSIQSVL
jgi:stage V sporulation protein B